MNLQNCTKLILLTLFLVVPLSDCAKVKSYLLNKPQCNAKEQIRIDRLVAKTISVGPNGRPLPERVNQIKGFCRDTDKMIAEIEHFFKDGYKSEVKNLANLILYTIKSSLRKYCTKKRSKIINDLLPLAPCANKHILPRDHCLQDFTNKTKQLFDLNIGNKKFSYTCCYFSDFMKCFENVLDDVKCIRKSRNIIMEYFRNIMGNLPETICGEYTEATDACEVLGKAPSPPKLNRQQYHSPIFAVIDMLESMEGFNSPI